MELFALINVDKPAGLTSHDVVARLRRIFGLKRVGHLGTLDPMATGVLPVCLGQATRLIEYFPDDKRYRATITFGVRTDTHDAVGEVTHTQPAGHLLPGDIDAALPAFVGTFPQQVPLHAAVHVDGKRLYSYAHQGIEVTPPTRETTIYQLERIDFQPGEHPQVTVDLHCASGTYVRALARDLGEALGVGAHLSALVRTAHGRLSLDTAVSLEALAEDPSASLLNPLDWLDLPVLRVETEATCVQLAQGMAIPPEPGMPRLNGQAMYLAAYGDQPVAVVQAEAKRLKPKKVFFKLNNP